MKTNDKAPAIRAGAATLYSDVMSIMPSCRSAGGREQGGWDMKNAAQAQGRAQGERKSGLGARRGRCRRNTHPESHAAVGGARSASAELDSLINASHEKKSINGAIFSALCICKPAPWGDKRCPQQESQPALL